MDSLIVVSRNRTIATVVLNRPQKLNALTREMWHLLGETMTELSSDEDLRCVILRGAGEKAFSPGNDISEFENERSNREQAVAYGHTMFATTQALANCRHPVVAQIHGLCVGGGLEIASLCDLRICGESSRFGVPIKNLGVVLAYPELEPLLRLAGPAATAEILLEGRILDAAEAKEKGLVTRVVPDAEVAAEALATARRIAEGAPLVARFHKRAIRKLAARERLTEADLASSFDCFESEDFRIGYQAFLAKRKPEFRGR
jgi:enoyl-CoA hydratase/carnithine racemase